MKFFSTTDSGLTEDEALDRQRIHGFNEVRREVSWRWLWLFLQQFNNVFAWILLTAAVLALFFHEYRDTVIIFLIVLINGLVGFFQEFKAERILEQIKNLTTDKAIVIRDGQKREIEARSLVPGDVVYLAEGDKTPADLYLLESYALYVNDFIYTGESTPQKKLATVMREGGLEISETDNMVFTSSDVTRGEGRGVVVATGMGTELGKIANLAAEVKDEDTPLQQKMKTLGRDVAKLSILLAAIVLIAGVYNESSLYQSFLFALAIAVSVVPEGLPAALSVALTLGMKRLLKHNVLAKRLVAVETLGSVSVICTDKTGTITRNELTVTKVVLDGTIMDVTGQGYRPEGEFHLYGRKIDPADYPQLEMIMRIGTLCNDSDIVRKDGAFGILGDPTEGAIKVAAQKFARDRIDFFRSEQKIGEIPFSSERRRMSVIYRNSRTVSYVKGSPDMLLELCAYHMKDGKVLRLDDVEKLKIRSNYNELSAQALRVLAFAYRDLADFPEQDYVKEAEADLVWVGMMAMIDPPRAEVAEAIVDCRRAGIKVVMITGDYEITARAIAKNVGLIRFDSDEVVSGRQLDALSDRQIENLVIDKNVVFARINPLQKFRIASVLKKSGMVIAMTGDGVNDALALKKADIGVAMGQIGTDVSKEASDMILLDDNFASIVKGVREGRIIYANIKKFVHYVFTSNASEFFSVIFGILLGIPAPITAVQILLIDLGTDIFPSFALGFEPEEPHAMEGRILKMREKVVDFGKFRRIIYLGVIMAVGGVVGFLWSLKRGGWDFGQPIDFTSELYIKSSTVTYAVLAMTQMANVLHSRSERFSPFRLGLFKNRPVIYSIAVSISMLLIFMYWPLLQKYIHMRPIDGWDWLVVLVSCLVVFLFEEARKDGLAKE